MRIVGLLHHIGGGNLGDDATQDAIIQNIGRRWPDAVLVGFSMNPDDTARRHGIRAYPIRTRQWIIGSSSSPELNAASGGFKRIASRNRMVFGVLRAINAVLIRAPRSLAREIAFIVNSYRIVKTLDVFVINGGGQLTEWGGPWGFPYTIFKWVVLAKVARVRRVFLNVGAGPLTRPLSRFFARRALRAADYVSFRDEDSRTLARRIGFEGASRVFPDSAYSLVSPGLRSIDANPDGGNASVGLAPMPYCDPRKFHEKDQVVYEAFIRKLGRFGSSLVGAGYAVALFGSDIGTDHLAIDDLQNAIVGDGAAAGASSRIERARVTTLDELLTAISAMDYVVTCRFHGIVFAHLLNKPVLAVSHHPKMTALMSDIGLARYCVDIRTFEPDSLMKTFAAMVADGDQIRQRMAAKLAYNRDMLTRQLDELFPIAAPLVQPSRVAVGGSF